MAARPHTKPALRVLAALALCATARGAQCEEALLFASDRAVDDSLGVALDLDGDTAVVGAWLHTHGGFWSGAAYVFERGPGGWSEQAELLPLDPQDGQRFGRSVAIHGDTIVVGAYLDDAMGSGAGAAYVFVRSGTTWSQEAKLVPSNAAAYQEFGRSVDVEGDRVAVGAPTSLSFLDAAGWAYVFERTGSAWNETALLVPGDPKDDDYFGGSVALAGDELFVGAPYADFDYGATYRFTHGGGAWSQTLKIKPGELSPHDGFGTSLAVADGRLVIGAPGHDAAAPDAGAAWVYESDAGVWKKRAVLHAPDAELDDGFGDTVAVSGNRIAVGSPREDGDCTFDCRHGKAYVFEGSGSQWFPVHELVAPDGKPYDRFADAVALSGDTLLCGSPYAGVGGLSDAGKAYVFTYAPLGTTYCDANANSTGARGAISGSGSAVLAENCLLLRGTKLPANRFGYFLFSQATDFVPFFAGSQGNLCLAAPIVRFASNALNSGSAGSMYFRPDLDHLPQGTTFAPGETWHFQLWYRDVNPTPTSNTTDGLSVIWS